MSQQNLIQRLCDFADEQGTDGGVFPTSFSELLVLRIAETTPLHSVAYAPSICLVLQGRKEARLDDEVVSFGAGESLIVGHDMTVTSRITEATTRKPYVALVLQIDLAEIRELYADSVLEGTDEATPSALGVGRADDALINALVRLFDLLERPNEALVMKPLLLREIHFRLLTAHNGAVLRQLKQPGSNADRVARVIARIKRDFALRLPIEELARTAAMSPSSLYDHFKAYTGTTPLGFKKELQLTEAQRLLREEAVSVSRAALAVGYTSPTQFSREFSRRFGMTPRAAKNLGPEPVAVVA